jgi:hypothetical protein
MGGPAPRPTAPPTCSILDGGARHQPVGRRGPRRAGDHAGGGVNARGEPTPGGGRLRRCGEAVVALEAHGYGNGGGENRVSRGVKKEYLLV